MLFHRPHSQPPPALLLRCPAAPSLGGSGQAPLLRRDHAPALRDRVNAAFLALLRSQRSPVVEVGAPVPLAIPRMFLDSSGIFVGVPAELCGYGRVAAGVHVNGKGPQGRDEEPGQPHALAPSLETHPVHAVIPVADSDQRQAVLAGGAGSPECPETMLVYTAVLVGDLG